MNVFFYGLFMDDDILNESGIVPKQASNAFAMDFALRIGHRATLVPANGEKAYGRLMTLSRDDLDTLYGAPGLELYKPQQISAQTEQGEVIDALCYNLEKAPAPQESNAAYAEQLKKVLNKYGFPEDYVRQIY